jgi:hypothetical protein
VLASDGNFAAQLSNRVWAYAGDDGSWSDSGQISTLSHVVASGGNFAAVASTRVHAWNQADGAWHLSPLFGTFAGEVAGADGNFAASVSNRIYAFSASDSSWNQSPQISGLGLVEGSPLPLCAPEDCDAGPCDVCNPELGCVAPPLPECTEPAPVPSLSAFGAGSLAALIGLAGLVARHRELRAQHR